ncbi:Arm DNA-binding domain-containing protein [Enterovirga sp.]|uniref:Arm DNA-binding domain-containing protein n=1 Tax=Enterovirga sp. TaxID=2026350 RepID=UPI002D04B872|nr:Arm DNA-binding domain-containing protein [Enterovirga sp.]HMO28892.1 Arm DNA-binding domain-containing protein [Enterovirga sp.]
MAREINRLSARRVQTISEPGRHADGGGLYLFVEPGGAKRWVMLYHMAGRRREMGLGNTISVPLAKAREAAAEARALIQQRIDPIEARNSTVAPAKAAPTFGEVAEAYMADREAAWRNAVHRRQWRQTLEV